jgi:uncharacterized membrane protein
MSRTAIFVLTLASAVGSGVVGGIWFAFSNFVMAALWRLPPEKGIAAMQSINLVVLNPVFFLAFFGTAVACLPLAIISLLRWGQRGWTLMLAGVLLYIVGSIGVTIAGNVPLNEALAVVDPTSSEAATIWQHYVSRWLFWNHLRTIGTIAAAILFILTLANRSFAIAR